MKKAIFVFAMLISSSAFAENFLCQGTGRFAGVGQQQVSLQWTKSYQKVIFESQATKVQVHIDKANSDGTHYLAIEVLDTDVNGAVKIATAKGSIKDMVLYGEGSSVINCLPLKN